MKPESKKSRGKGEASSIDIKHNEIESCYDFSNFSKALDVINPNEPGTRKDGGSAYDFGDMSRKDGGSAYDFGDMAKQLSTIEHKEMKVSALRSRAQKRREYLRMRSAFIDAIMCPSPSLVPVMLASIDSPLRPPPRFLRDHMIPPPPPDFLLSDDRNEARIGSAEIISGPLVDVPVHEVEEMKEGGGSQVSHSNATPMIELERPYPIMSRLSRIVSLGHMRRSRRNWRVVLP